MNKTQYKQAKEQSELQHKRTLELDMCQFEHAKAQGEREHSQQLELDSRQWQREKAYDLLVSLNSLYGAVRESFTVCRLEYERSGNWQITDESDSARLAANVSACTLTCVSLIRLISDRKLVFDAIRMTVEMSNAAAVREKAKADAALIAMSHQFPNMNDQISEYARSL